MDKVRYNTDIDTPELKTFLGHFSRIISITEHSPNHCIDSSFPKSVIFDRALRLPKNALKYFRLVGGQEGREALFETFTHDASVVIIIILVTPAAGVCTLQ